MTLILFHKSNGSTFCLFYQWNTDNLMNFVVFLSQECSSDILEFVPEIHEAFEFGNDLRRDKSVKADSREVIESEIHEIDEGFKNLKSDIEDFEKQ